MSPSPTGTLCKWEGRNADQNGKRDSHVSELGGRLVGDENRSLYALTAAAHAMYWLLSDEESVDCFLAGDSPFRRSLVVNWTGGWSTNYKLYNNVISTPFAAVLSARSRINRIYYTSVGRTWTRCCRVSWNLCCFSKVTQTCSLPERSNFSHRNWLIWCVTTNKLEPGLRTLLRDFHLSHFLSFSACSLQMI